MSDADRHEPSHASTARQNLVDAGVSLVSDALDAEACYDRALAPLTAFGAPSPFAGPVLTLRFEALPAEERFPEVPLDRIIEGLSRREDYLQRGGVLAIGFEGAPPFAGVVGGLLAKLYRRLGVEGVITDGYVRDLASIRACGLPVRARAPAPVNARGRVRLVGLGQPVQVAGVVVAEGDVVVADDDGVVAIPQQVASDPSFAGWIEDAQARDRRAEKLLDERGRLSEVLQRVDAL